MVASADALRLSDARIRLPLPGQTTAVVYMQLHNQAAQALTIRGVEVEGAGASELHQHVHRDGMMRMRRLEQISVASGQQLAFESGSYHIMAFRMEVSTRLATQDDHSYTVTLILDSGQRVSTEAKVMTL
tara:strand:- start:23023 stop:23412 length:390 start_codon:yes stop_codon:yes gene_type:complete